MFNRVNTTTLFCAGWFLAIMLPAFGLLPRLSTFMLTWYIELPAAVLLALCCGYLIARPPQHFRLTRDEIRFVIVPISLFIAWSLISALWATSWRSAIHHTLVWAMYVIFYLVVRAITKTENGIRCLGITLLAVLSIFALVAVSGYVSFLVFGGRNELGRLAQYGEQIVTVLPLLLIAVVGLKGRAFWIGSAAVTLLWLLIFCTSGRINLFLFLTVFGITTLLVLTRDFFHPRHEENSLTRSEKNSAATFASSALRFAFIVAAVVVAPVVVQTFSLLSEKPEAAPVAFQRLADDEGLQSSNNFRRLMNSVSKEMILAHPLVGIGADNFGFQANEYRKLYSAKQPDDPALREAEDTLPERAHNEFLQIADELGVVGVMIVLWFGGGLILLLYRAVRGLRTGSVVGPAAVIGLGAFCVSSLVSSYSFRSIQGGFVFFLILAIAYRELGSTDPEPGVDGSEVPAQRSNLKIRVACLAGLLSCLLLVGYWTPRIASAGYAARANRTQDLDDAERLYRISENLDEDNADVRYYHGMRLFSERKFADAVPLVSKAVQIGRAPSDVFSQLASARTLAGDNAGAERTMADALKMYPQSAFVLTRYAHLLAVNGKTAESEAILSRARSRDIRAANSWWAFLNESSDSAADKAIKHPDQYTALMDLQPLAAVYAVLDEQKARIPDDKKLDLDFGNR